MPVTRPGAPALDGSRIDRWTAAVVPWWVPRLALAGAWIAALVTAAAGDPTSCTATDPSVCGPDVTFAVALVPLVATPFLLWWIPLAGCGAGVTFAVLDLIYDDVPAANLAFGVHGLLCLAVAVWLVADRRRQAAIVAEVAGPIHLDTALTERLRVAFPRWGERTAAAVLLVLGGIGGLAWYGHRAAQVAAHESAAVRADGVIRSVDNTEGTIAVEVPQPVEVDVVGSYEAGQVIPVLVDGAWVRPVAEPEDVTGWLGAGLGALCLAALLLVREQRMRSAGRRLLGGPLSAVELTTELDDHGRAVLPDGMAVVPVVAAPMRSTSPLVTDEDEERTAEEIEDFGRQWRGDGQESEPQTVTVAGDLRDGGWVLLISDSVVLLPEAPLRMPRRRPEVTKAPPGEPLPPMDTGDLPELPVVLWSRPRDRVLGALSLLGFAIGPAVVLAGAPDGWWQTVLALWAGGHFAYQGWCRLNTRVELTRSGLVAHGRGRVHHVPWQRLYGVRHDEKGLWLAWEPGSTFQIGGVADRWGAVMMRLRELSLAAGDPGGRVTSRLGGASAVVLVYAFVAIATVWWQHR
ncbi:hypothetical protein Are01nite_61210 [Actinoplanes regularis]|nr:hypothetical protein Are01nite_61210 [Actinoplanes regularis]